MSEEEKEAIEDLKKLKKGIEVLNSICEITKTEKDEVDIKAIDIILNLIEKQQKEIEQLKEIKWYYESSRVSKDKIRDFYKKYCKEAMNEFSPYIKDNATPEKERKSGQIKILEKIRKELLGE